MKKNLSGIVLVAEIVAIVLLHTFKLRNPENTPLENSVVRVGKSLVNIPKAALFYKTRQDNYFVNMLK